MMIKIVSKEFKQTLEVIKSN